MRTVRDHKRSFLHSLPNRTTAELLREFFVLHEWTEPIFPSSLPVSGAAPETVFKKNEFVIAVPQEIIDDSVGIRALLSDATQAFIRCYTTSESVELHPAMTRDDAAVALWQAANTIAAQHAENEHLRRKIANMQDTATRMFGGDVDDICELLGIERDW